MNKQTRKSQIYSFIYLNKKLICFISLAYNFKKLITFQIKQHKQIFQSIFKRSDYWVYFTTLYQYIKFNTQWLGYKYIWKKMHLKCFWTPGTMLLFHLLSYDHCENFNVRTGDIFLSEFKSVQLFFLSFTSAFPLEIQLSRGGWGSEYLSLVKLCHIFVPVCLKPVPGFPSTYTCIAVFFVY